MKKIKGIVAMLLSLCMVAVSGAAFTACSGDGNNGGNGEQVGSGEQGGEQKDKTTVANAEEWKAAFVDLFKADSVHTKVYMESSVDGEEDDSSDGDCYVDLKNGQLLDIEHDIHYSLEDGVFDAIHTMYYEISGESIYRHYTTVYKTGEVDEWAEKHETWLENLDNVGEYYFSEKPETERSINADFVGCGGYFSLLFTLVGTADTAADDQKFLPDWFSEFTYEDGRYVSDSLGQTYFDYELNTSVFICVHFEVEIKNGLISKIEISNDNTSDGVRYHSTTGFTVESINSTTITIPEGAREAIDAEKAKDNK